MPAYRCTIHMLSAFMVTNSQIEKLLNVKVDTYYLLRFQLFDNCKNPFTFKSSLGGGFRAKINCVPSKHFK